MNIVTKISGSDSVLSTDLQNLQDARDSSLDSSGRAERQTVSDQGGSVSASTLPDRLEDIPAEPFDLEGAMMALDAVANAPAEDLASVHGQLDPDRVMALVGQFSGSV